MASFENENRRKLDAADYTLPPLSHLQENKNRILDYLENQLSADERRVVEGHLAVCPECQVFCQQVKQLDAALAQALRRPELSAEFTTLLKKRIATESVSLPASSRNHLKRQMEEEFHTRSAQLRKGFLSLPELLEGFGYAAIAAMAASILVQLLTGDLATRLTAVTRLGISPALFFTYAASAICLVAGLSFALKRPGARWLSMF